MEIPKSFLGYKRENGRAGTRNHVIILPVDDISNACAEAVANNIKGTIALPHSYGRLQFGADLELHFRTMIGTGKNPNVAAVIVIGIEPKWTKKIVDAIAETGKPVEGFHIERSGDIETIMKASKKAQDCSAWIMENEKTIKVTSTNAVPLGHKIALKDLKEGDTILKYGHDIGKVVKNIKKGEHVHVHNVKTKKW